MFVGMIAAAYPHATLSYPMTLKGVGAIVEWLFPNRSSALLAEYADPNADTVLDNIITDGLFSCSNRYAAIQFANHGKGKSYLLDWHAAFAGGMRTAMGAIHAESTGHLFYYSHGTGMWPTEGAWEDNPEQRDLAIWLNCLSARLAHCGDPTGCGGHEIP